MDPSESIHRDGLEPPPCCDQGASLSAYYDGELDAASAAAVERHLAACDECRAELQEMRELSALAERLGSEGMSAAGLRKIHRAVDAEEGYTVLRIAAVLTGLAASAMVIGSVWLSEIPASRPQQPFVVITDTESPAMRVAMGDLRVEPLPKTDLEVQHQQMFADAGFAEWMLDGLSGKAR